MKISIVTPSLNQGRFIEETIKSVIYQKGDFELEYIIMDGGSSDNSLEIVKKYDKLVKSEKFKLACKKLVFKWFSEKDKGQSHAINKGFKIASGDIVNWLCSDDLFEQGALQRVVDFFEENKGAKIVFGNALKIDENGNIIGFFKGREFVRKELIERWSGYFGNYEIIQPSLFFKKELLFELGYLNENSHFAMDYEWWLKTSKKYKFFYIDEILARARFYKDTKSVKNQKETFQALIRFSKRYWHENYSEYFISYFFYNLKKPFFKLSALLKKKSRIYNGLIYKIKVFFRII